MDLDQSLMTLLEAFRPAFTKPTFLTFQAIVAGWILSHRHRFITDIIVSAGKVGQGHFGRFHRFFSHAAWNLDTVCWCLAKLLIETLVPTGIIELAVDDTLAKKRGLTIYGTGMHHDPLISSRGKRLTSWGLNWVVVTLIIGGLPWAPGKVWSLPIGFRLYRNRQGLTKGKKKVANKANPTKQTQPKSAKKKNHSKKTSNKKKKAATTQPAKNTHRTRPELAVELLQLVAGWFPGREFVVYGDSAYGGGSVLKHLPENMDLVSHVHSQGHLYKPAPPRQPGQRGATRKKGDRLPDAQAWANDKSKRWKKHKFDQFGLHATLQTKTMKALYYTAGKDRLLKIVLVRDTTGQRPLQRFYCTRLDWDARQILGGYAGRWSIEVTFENCKQHLGFGDAANRIERAVGRTAPMAGVWYSLIVLWFNGEGHHHVQFPDRPWYRHKRDPSFADMLTTLRRVSCENQFEELLAKSGPLSKAARQLTYFFSLAG